MEAVIDILPHRPCLLLNAKAEKAIANGHPWVMKDSIEGVLSVESVSKEQPLTQNKRKRLEPLESLNVGDQVNLVGSHGNTLASGLVNPHSRIAVRMYSRDASREIDESFILDRVQNAIELRANIGFVDDRNAAGEAKAISHNAVRLLFSEGDHCSGLIIDRFANHYVIQQTSAVMSRFIRPIVEYIKAHLAPLSITHVIDEATAKLENMTAIRQVIFGAYEGMITFEENKLLWRVDLEKGQKTGHYLDQSINRSIPAKYLHQGEVLHRNQSKRLILDVCCYQGGFGLTIASQIENCHVFSIDGSRAALETAQKNADTNGLRNVSFIEGDAFEVLEDLSKSEQALQDFLANGLLESHDKLQRFDCIILDPPKLAGSRDSIDRALRAYHRLNFLATKLLRSGGILVSCSCSGRITHEDFQWMLRGVARQSRKPIQILERRGAAPDHPVNVCCPETDYLKCYICRVGEIESNR